MAADAIAAVAKLVVTTAVKPTVVATMAMLTTVVATMAKPPAVAMMVAKRNVEKAARSSVA